MRDFSEPGGVFRSANVTNLTSNEFAFQDVIPALIARTGPGGVYLGVGPEQNFTYMAAVRPSMAFLFDVRRGNLDLQLMYKAIFELSRDRADFVSRLFSRARPPGLGPTATGAEMFEAFDAQPASASLYDANLRAVETRLTKTHGFPLTGDDLASLREVYRTFFARGFAVRRSPTYADLMTATDAAGVPRSFLATEEAFAWLKDLQQRNLAVPVVGDFAGPKAIRAVAAYLESVGATVSVFYLSNVEQYLYQDGRWGAFCRNVATLPLADRSTFIRSASGWGGGGGPRFVSSLGEMAREVATCPEAR